MIVNPETAKLRTSREFPQMVLAEQTIVDDTLVITAGGKTIKVPLVPSYVIAILGKLFIR